MMVFDHTEPAYWDKEDLKKEMFRVFDICNGCRLCDNLCPSFNKLFRRIEEEDDRLTAGKSLDNPVTFLTDHDYEEVTDLCYQCKLCYPKCPYTPPHDYLLDFPRLLTRAQAIRVKENGISFRDKLLSNPDRAGSIGSKFPALMNWLNSNKLSRVLMEKTVRIHREKMLPKYHGETFEAWFERWRRSNPAPEQPAAKVAFYTTCLVHFNNPDIGKDAVRVLHHNKVEVAPGYKTCCGMPSFGIGDLEEATKKADANLAYLLPLVEAGYDIVIPSPSCSLMVRQEYPLLAGDRDAARKVAEHTYDLMEYLKKLGDEGKLSKEFDGEFGEITYHLPCHLKAQNIGYKSRDVLRMLPGARVEMIEQCSGHDGQWSMKKEYFSLSLHAGRKLFRKLEKKKSAATVSDCAFAQMHIAQATGQESEHPVSLLARAYKLK